MFVSAVSPHQYQGQQSAQWAQESGHIAAAGTNAFAEQSGGVDLFLAEKLYREKSEELKRLSSQTGKYEVETLSDSEIKSLRLAGVAIDEFLKQHGQKLGAREFSLLADLIQKARNSQAVAATGGAASTSTAATTTATARAYV